MPLIRTSESFPRGEDAAAWEDLVCADPAATIFSSARFLRLWCRHLRGECDLRIRLVDDGDRLVGVVPEVRELDGDRRTVHFAGGEHVTDYLGPVSRPEHRGAVARSWIETLADEDDWDVLAAGGLAGDAGWHEEIAAAAHAVGLDVDGPEVIDVCPRVDLAGGWEGYLDRLSGKNRHEIRRKSRRLARDAGSVALRQVDPEDLKSAVDTFASLHRTSPGEKGEFFDRPGMKEFFHALIDEFGPDDEVRIHELQIDGRAAAMTVSLVHAGAPGPTEWGLYNSSYDPDHAALSPGMVLVAELIRIAAEEGCDTFDLLRGAEPYKYRFGAVDRRLCRVTIRRNGEAAA